MNLIELNRALVQLRLSGMAAVMETRLLQAQSQNMAPIDLIRTYGIAARQCCSASGLQLVSCKAPSQTVPGSNTTRPGSTECRAFGLLAAKASKRPAENGYGALGPPDQ